MFNIALSPLLSVDAAIAYESARWYQEGLYMDTGTSSSRSSPMWDGEIMLHDGHRQGRKVNLGFSPASRVHRA
jgi:hypothetical protein